MSADFIDTNIVVYMLDPAGSQKRSQADVVVGQAIAEGNALISFQVVQETLSVISSKLSNPVPVTDMWEFFENVLQPLWKTMPTPGLYRRALELQERYRYHFYDSLILAAALDSGCDRLLSEDFQHGQNIEGLTIHNPFL